MTEYSTSVDQIINPGESAIFDLAPVPCNRGFVRHRNGSGNFLLSGWIPNFGYGCRCSRNKSATYSVNVGGNIAVPTGETVGAISLALALDGSTLPDSYMIETPAAVEEYSNIGVTIPVEVFRGCCETISLRNVGTTPVQLRAGAHIGFERPDLAVSY